MQLLESQQRYGLVTQLLHWILAGLFAVQYFLVYRSAYFAQGTLLRTQYILLHKSLGITILALAVFFVIWRSTGPTRPPLPDTLSFRLKCLARGVHLALYGVLLVMPLTGYLMAIANNRPVLWFGLQLPTLLAPTEVLGDFFYLMHVYLSYCIIGLVALHVLAALQHHFISKDQVLRRMLPFKT